MDEGKEVATINPSSTTEKAVSSPTSVVERIDDSVIHVGESIFLKEDNETFSPTPATEEIMEEIKRQGGRIPFSTFMKISLYGQHGYYSEGKVKIGKEGDFITWPEVTELFGAGVGSALVKVWEAMDRPAKFHVVEMGAGQAALARSLLRYIEEIHPDFYEALQYTILEYGRELIPRQQDKIKSLQEDYLHKVRWVHGSAYELPFREVEGVFISNELPDAFPIESVRRVNGEIKQKYIIFDLDNFREVWKEPSQEVSEYINEFGIEISEGSEEPININATKFQKNLDTALKKGAILTIDYGGNGEVSPSGQGSVRLYGRDYSQGKVMEAGMGPAYHRPGDVDITASVNFKPLETIAVQDGLQVGFSGLQSEFFKKAGIDDVANNFRFIFMENNSWGDSVDLARSLRMFSDLLADHIFYSQLLLKGIDPSTISWNPASPSRLRYYHPFIPQVGLQIARPGERIRMELNSSKPGSKNISRETVTTEVDPEGFVGIKIDQLEGAKIFSEDGGLLLDLTDEEQLKKVVQGAGYTYT